MRHSSRSLTAHLRETEDHSRLPFHPVCPVCRRDRLAGSLDGEELVSRRTQAAIAAGLLAFSTGGVSAAAAQVPDEIAEGTAEVVAGDDPTEGLEFDPGDETVQLPDEATLITDAATLPADEDEGPVEQEPATDVNEPVVEATEAPAEPTPAPSPEPAVPSPTPVPEAAAPPAEGEVRPVQAPAGPRAFEADRRGAPRADRPSRASTPAQPRTEVAVVEPVPATAPATPSAEPAAAPAATVRVAGSSDSHAAPGDRIHVVRSGESLWSIAADVLGKKATVASIAREVNRLWELNEERIGTGQPDLLLMGTRLTLR